MNTYGKEFKDNVGKYALEYSVDKARDRFNVPSGTIRRWVKILTNPQNCSECSAVFPSLTEHKKHAEIHHSSVANVPRENKADLPKETFHITTENRTFRDLKEEMNLK